jgi:two-component system sensor histidine kinase BaeS
MPNLRTRFLISHITPLLILSPIIGITLLYLWQNYYVFDILGKELTGQARIAADFIGRDYEVWSSPQAAAIEGKRLQRDIAARIMLLNQNGKLLYSSNQADQERVGQILNFPVVTKALNDQSDWQVTYNSFLREQIVDVGVPVIDTQSHTIGVLRLSYSVADIEQRLFPLRWLVGITIFIATLAALMFAVLLANWVSAPLRNLAHVVNRFAPDTAPKRIPETGPHEARMLAANFNHMSQQLHELEVGRKELLASVVHELGAPLSAIKAAAQALQRGAVTDQNFAVELAEGIDSQVDQLTLLLDDLTLLRSAEVRGFALDCDWNNLVEIVREECRSYAYLIKHKHIHLTYNLPDDLPLVLVDRERVCQIISNLISNAHKYTPVGGSIHVSLSKEIMNTVPYASLKVTDTGPGIASSEQTKVFSLFYRSPNVKNLKPGMGIGLTLSQQLAEAHGGSLSVHSVIGQGATFILRLPLETCDPSPYLPLKLPLISS